MLTLVQNPHQLYSAYPLQRSIFALASTIHMVVGEGSARGMWIPGISSVGPLSVLYPSLSNSSRYWNWPLWADNLAASPLFDGSETSISGDGEYNPGEQNMSGGNVTLLRGSGGGCAKSGPFKDMKVHMGPFPGSLSSFTEIPAPRFEYNPRCLNRSLNDFVSSRYTNSTLVSTLMKTSKIADFQMVLDHWPPRQDGVLGLHGGGHFSIGSTMQDLFGSSQDPAFFLHHSQIDRLWAKWQDADANRRNAVNGTSTILNPPGADPVTLDTIMDFGYLDSPRPVHEVMSPLANGFFYVYT